MTWTFNAEKEIEHIVNWIKKYFAQNGPSCKAVIGISGGKDSTIAAALCARALGPENVVGVMMPQGKQSDLNDARQVCSILGITAYNINIGAICNDLYQAIDMAYDYDHSVANNVAVATNTPARIRMTTLYAIAALVHGRVCNTCNASEDYVGYSTKYGDGAGDFAPLQRYTVRELLLIGDALEELPQNLVHKTPADGMCGKSDEENLGFTYEELDSYLLDGTYPEYDKYLAIQLKHNANLHKLRAMPTCTKLSNIIEF